MYIHFAVRSLFQLLPSKKRLIKTKFTYFSYFSFRCTRKRLPFMAEEKSQESQYLILFTFIQRCVRFVAVLSTVICLCLIQTLILLLFPIPFRREVMTRKGSSLYRSYKRNWRKIKLEFLGLTHIHTLQTTQW